jgi:hypothetical protein
MPCGMIAQRIQSCFEQIQPAIRKPRPSIQFIGLIPLELIFNAALRFGR